MPMEKNVQGEKPFAGVPKKITLAASPCGFLDPPADDSPKTQKVTVTARGQVSFSSLNYAFPPARLSRGEWRKLTLNKAQAAELLEEIVAPFRTALPQADATDVGSWTLTAVNTADVTFRFSGRLFDGAFPGATRISDLIRETLSMPDLLCFDGGGK